MLDRWFADAAATDPAFYNAAVLATADRTGP
jgi:pyridoxamine 5'-phosphate oxidase